MGENDEYEVKQPVKITDTINIASDKTVIDDCESITGWSAQDQASGIVLSVEHIEGIKSISFDKSGVSGKTGYIEKTVSPIDLSGYQTHAIMHSHLYLSNITSVAKMFIRLGTDSSNYFQYDVSVDNLAVGWNDYDVMLTNRTSQAGNGADFSDITYIAIGIEMNANGNTLSGILVDNIIAKRMLEILTFGADYPEMASRIRIQDRNSGKLAEVNTAHQLEVAEANSATIEAETKALIDDTIKGIMRSIGDAGATPTNATGNTLLKLIDLLINTDGIKKITDTVTVQATDLDIRNLTKSLDELYSVLKTDAGVAYDARARSWNLGASDVPDLSDRAARLLGRVYGSEGLQLKQEPTTGELHIKKLVDELPAGTQKIGKVEGHIFEEILFDFETQAEVDAWIPDGIVVSDTIFTTTKASHGSNSMELELIATGAIGDAYYLWATARDFSDYYNNDGKIILDVRNTAPGTLYHKIWVALTNEAADAGYTWRLKVTNTYNETYNNKWTRYEVPLRSPPYDTYGALDWTAVKKFFIMVETRSASRDLLVDYIRLQAVGLKKTRATIEGHLYEPVTQTRYLDKFPLDVHPLGSQGIALKQRATTGEVHAIPGGLSYARCAADTQVKATAGFLHTITLSQTAAAAPTAGVLTIYDSAAESGTVILNIYLSNAVLLPVTIHLDVECGTGIYIGYDATLAGIEAVVSYL